MHTTRLVAVDVHPHNALRYVDWDAIVCVDIIRATSSLVTSVKMGRQTFSAATVEEAFRLARELDNPLLAGEVGGVKPRDFEIQNSPAEIATREDIERPLILVSTSGTRLIANAASCPAVYIASFQNLTATADYIADRHGRVAVIGAGSRFEFRREDQMGTSWIAEKLMDRGFEAENERTQELVQRWSGARLTQAGSGNSAAYLRKSGQEADLDFVLGHYDDFDSVCISVMNRVHAIDSGVVGKQTSLGEESRVSHQAMFSPAARAE